MNQPVPPDLLQLLEALTPDQLVWLSGYAWGRSRGGVSGATAAPGDAQAEAAPAQGTDPGAEITVFSASQTGNALAVAQQFHGKLVDQGFNARLVSAGDFKSRNIGQLSIVLFVISTQGEGDPPEEAIPLFKFLNGKKAPDLSSMKYAILALGDTSYTDSYCQAGRDLDKRLSELGAQTLADRVDCDLDYQAAAGQWQTHLIERLQEFKGGPVVASGAEPAAGAAAVTAAVGASQYTKESPFEASMLVRQKITSREALKDVQHIEIDLEGSGIQYQPGDALGIYYENAARLVDEILQHTQVGAEESVELADKQSLTIREALTRHLDITQNTPALVKAYAQHSDSADLQELVTDMNTLNDYVNNNPPVRVFADFAGTLTAQQLCDLFRPLTPRLYSIASSQEEVGEEVHITLGVVRFTNHDVVYTGGASGYLAEALEEGDSVRVFIEENKHFRLPQDEKTNIIMIGAGTGVAPYRAFMQEREAKEHTGQNWLIFGNQNFLNDFLYQAEWLQYREKGLLNRYDFAWSRDTDQKVYVQHKLKEKGADIWQWLQDGAHIYVCGDAARMAKDVELTLQELVAEHGNMSLDDADEYLSELRENNRYQRDVY